MVDNVVRKVSNEQQYNFVLAFIIIDQTLVEIYTVRGSSGNCLLLGQPLTLQTVC